METDSLRWAPSTVGWRLGRGCGAPGATLWLARQEGYTAASSGLPIRGQVVWELQHDSESRGTPRWVSCLTSLGLSSSFMSCGR